jgi:hypothetical protein
MNLESLADYRKKQRQIPDSGNYPEVVANEKQIPLTGISVTAQTVQQRRKSMQFKWNRLRYALNHFGSRRILGEADNDRADGGPGSHFTKIESKVISAEMTRLQHDLSDDEANRLLNQRLNEVVNNDNK